MLNKNKIIFHSNDSHLWDAREFLIYRMQMGVLVAEEGDVVISPIPFDDYHLDYLKSLNAVPDNIRIWSPSRPVPKPYSSFFQNSELKNILNQYRKTHYVDIFTPGQAEQKLFEDLEMDVLCNFRTAMFFNDKSNFRRFLNTAGINILRGYEFLGEPADIQRAVEELFETKADAVIVKKNNSCAGFGNVKIERSHFGPLSANKRKDFVVSIFNYLGGASDKFLVEEFLGGKISSPSFQYICLPDASFKLVCVQDQLFRTEPNFFNQILFNGNSFPYSPVNPQAFQEVTSKISTVLTQLVGNFSYQGYVGFDAVLNQNGLNFIIDANVRRIMAHYPFFVASRLFKDQNPAYAYVSYFFPSKAIRSFKELHNLINKMRLKSDMIVLDFFPYYRNSNRASTLFIGRDKEDVFSAKNTFDFFLNDYFVKKNYEF